MIRFFRSFNFFTGHPGHGSFLLKNTAGEKVRKLLDRLIDFRDTQVKRLNDNPELTIGDVTTGEKFNNNS